MKLSDLKNTGHWPTLLAAFLYFDFSFMVWTVLGPLGAQIGETLNLSPEQKGLMVALPIVAGAVLQILLGLLVDRVGAKNAGIIAQLVVITGLALAWIFGLPIYVNRIPNQNSLAYDQIVEGIANDKIKGLWVVATNSSHSWINQAKFNEIVKKLDFLVVQDMYFTTETAQRAHLILPAAGWGEKVGTFINSERRIGLVKRVSRAPGQALSDFNIFKLVAQYWAAGKCSKNGLHQNLCFRF